MLLQNALEAAIRSQKFKDLLQQNNIDIDVCHEVNAVMKWDGKSTWYYDIYFNYNNPKTKDKDINATVQILENGTVKVLSILLL